MGLEGYDQGEVLARSLRTVVRRARRKSDGISVVIKSLAKEYPPAHEVDQLESEYQLLSRLRVSSIIRAHGLEKDGNGVAIVLEDFGGRDVLEPGATAALPLDRFFTVAATITGALGQLHACGIVHKDVKPANIIVNGETGEVKLIDFNISSDLSSERDEEKTGEQLEGSLPYISPEQTGRMNRDLDYRTDYYSLGVTFFELLTGRLPFSATDMLGWVHCHMSQPVPDACALNPTIPASLSEMIRKLMAKSPEDRYQSAHGLLKDLERCRREWLATGESPRFSLGQHDVSERFQISSRLYGRETETATLLAALQATASGPATMLLVTGGAGVGKSALMEDTYHASLAWEGHDGAKKGRVGLVAWVTLGEDSPPYGAICQALRALIKQLLAERDDRLNEWRHRLSAAIAPNGQVLVDLIPELQDVIGPQPPVPELTPEEAHPRFRRAFGQLIKALAGPSQPLVLFLDNLQWADRSTVELLAHLLKDGELRHVLVVGGLRDVEGAAATPLATAVADIARARAGSVQQIQLLPLTEAIVNRLLAATLRCDPAASEPLARTIHQKTAGNPFFVHELLHMLSREGAFRLDAEHERWSWNPSEIDRASLTDNVVDLMVQRLRRLPPDSLQSLCLAACLGSPFDVETLAALSEQPRAAVASALRAAVQDGILLPASSARFRFQHARLEQAAASLLSDEERARRHLQIGERLLASVGAAAREDRVFEIVGHLNRGRSLIADLPRRSLLADLNSVAGQRAHRATAYASATAHFEIALALMSPEEWKADAAWHFECRRAHIECLFLAGEIDRAASLCEELTSSAPDRVMAGSAFHLHARILEHQTRFADAIDKIRQGLGLLAIDLPSSPAEIQRRIGEGIGIMQAHLARTPIEDLVHLPPMTDGEKILAMNLLFQLIPSAIQTYPPLFLLGELMMFDLSFSHGITAASCKNFMDCGIIQGGILGDYPGAYRLAKVAFTLLERYKPTPLEAGLNFVFGHFVSHWRAPYRESLQAFERAQQAGKEMGNISHTAYACAMETLRLLLTGQQLDECQAHSDRAAAYLTGIHALGPLEAVDLVRRALVRLRGEDAAPAEGSDEDFTARLIKGRNAQYLFSHGQLQAMVSFLLGDLEAAARWDAFITPYLPAGTSLFALADHTLFQTLALVKRWPTLDVAQQEAARTTMDANLDKLAKWAANCPENFAHKHKLAAAEVARLRRAPLEDVLALYDQAAIAAGDDFPHLRALANELQGEMWIARDQRKIARAFVQEAHYLYQRWGARAKLRQLEKRFPEWLLATNVPANLRSTFVPNHTHTVDIVQGASLDTESVIKATQAISSEVTQERLYTRLMATIIENAGAQRGYLIIKSDAGELEVVARAGFEDAPRTAEASARIEDATELCPDIVRYVARTRDTVVLDDARRHERYQNDEYVRRSGIKSVLCVPVIQQGKLLGVLYAENNAVTHAFTPGRLNLLQVIASQAAISITNAQLYDSLEEKVVERTRELAEKNREVAVMLHSLHQGVFTIDERMVIQPQYSRHLEEILNRRDLAGVDCFDVLFAGSDISADHLAAARAALAGNFGAPTFIAEANEGHLVRVLRRQAPGAGTQDLEIDWSWIVDDHDSVEKVLVTLRDVTVIKQLTRTVREKSRELDIVGQILEVGLEAFQGFCRSSRVLISEIRAILVSDGSGPSSRGAKQLEHLLRNLHTVKGHARTLGLGHIVDVAHRAEDECVSLNQAADPLDVRGMVERADELLATVAEHEEVYERKLANLTAQRSTGIERALAEVQAAVRAAGGGRCSAAEALGEIERAVVRATATSIDELVRDAGRSLPTLARDLDKLPPVVDCQDAGLMLAEPFAQVMRDVLTHAFRNSLDHGIEGAPERREQRKPPQGHISVRPGVGEGRLVIALADDGRGLPLTALRAKTDAINASDEDLAERVFESGVSTAAALTSISGRGVGLDAIRSFLRKHDGDARIAFTGPARAGYRPFELILELPSSAIVS